MCIDCGQEEVNIPTIDRCPDFCSALSVLPARFLLEIGGFIFVYRVDMLYSGLEVPFSLCLSLVFVRSTPGQKRHPWILNGGLFLGLKLSPFFLLSSICSLQASNPFVLNRMFSKTSLFFEYGLNILSTLSWLYFVYVKLTTISGI